MIFHLLNKHLVVKLNEVDFFPFQWYLSHNLIMNVPVVLADGLVFVDNFSKSDVQLRYLAEGEDSAHY